MARKLRYTLITKGFYVPESEEKEEKEEEKKKFTVT